MHKKIMNIVVYKICLKHIDDILKFCETHKSRTAEANFRSA